MRGSRKPSKVVLMKATRCSCNYICSVYPVPQIPNYEGAHQRPQRSCLQPGDLPKVWLRHEVALASFGSPALVHYTFYSVKPLQYSGTDCQLAACARGKGRGMQGACLRRCGSCMYQGHGRSDTRSDDHPCQTGSVSGSEEKHPELMFLVYMDRSFACSTS